MAELPNLGKHCSFEECKRIDFLPISCSFCKNVFCKEHAFSDSHNCKEASIVITEKRRKIQTFKCAHPGCDNHEVSELECSGCTKHHCLTHRFPDSHNCPCFEPPNAYMPETTKVVQRIKEKATNQETKQVKNSKISTQVKLMKLKQKAVGAQGIPVEERIYFAVQTENSKDEKPLFVSKAWSMGKVVDAMAQLCGIPNNNHKAGFPKLCLYQGDKNVNERNDMKLSELLDGGILKSGDNVVLKLEG